MSGEKTDRHVIVLTRYSKLIRSFSCSIKVIRREFDLFRLYVDSTSKNYRK